MSEWKARGFYAVVRRDVGESHFTGPWYDTRPFSTVYHFVWPEISKIDSLYLGLRDKRRRAGVRERVASYGQYRRAVKLVKGVSKSSGFPDDNPSEPAATWNIASTEGPAMTILVILAS